MIKEVAGHYLVNDRDLSCLRRIVYFNKQDKPDQILFAFITGDTYNSLLALVLMRHVNS